MIEPKAYRGLDKLEPNFKKKVTKWLTAVEAMDIDIFVTETWRSDERQAYLRSKGLSKVVRSNHQDGKAVDIAFDVKRYGGLYPANMELWRKVADEAKECGIDWGYDLWAVKYGFIDKPHFQDNGLPIVEPPKINTSELSDAWHSIASFKEQYSGVISKSEIDSLEALQNRIHELAKIFRA